MTKEVYVSKKSHGDAPGSQDLASPVGRGFCSEVSVPCAGWGSCCSLARPQGLQLGWLLWSRCSAPSLPRQLTLSPENCLPKRARLPKGPTCVPNPAGISSLSEFLSPTPSRAAEPQDQAGVSPLVTNIGLRAQHMAGAWAASTHPTCAAGGQ